MPLTLPFPSFFTEAGGPEPASQLDSNFAAVNTSLTTEEQITAATTTDLGSVQSNNVLINFSGSPVVSAFGSSAITSQPFFNVRWAGTGTATLQNSSSIIIAGGANLTINPNDQGKAIYLGSGNWAYAPASKGQSFPGTSATLASATTTDLGTASSFVIDITGTTTITSFGSSALITAPIYYLTFADILQLTYNATSMILPTAANITTAAGDTAVAQYLGSGDWAIISYQRKSGVPLVSPTGNILQRVYAQTTAYTSTTNTIAYSNTLPTTSSGAQILSAAITPTSASNYLIILANVYLYSNSGGRPTAALFKSGSSNAICVSGQSTSTAGMTVPIMYSMLAGTTSAITFTVNVGDTSGTCYVNGTNSGALWGGACVSSIQIYEMTP